jgi:teichuronic acid biosynthesis glycosyltransferase TuaC
VKRETPRVSRILSLSTTYPNPSDQLAGSFIQSRLRRVATLAEVRVMAPVSKLHFFNLPHILTDTRNIPAERQDGELHVLHPRWIYPPMGGWLNAVFLAFQVAVPVMRLRRHFDFQLIDSHFAHPDGVAAALLSVITGLPFTVTLRGNEVEHALHRPRRLAMTWALKRASRVFAVSERLRQFAISLGVDPRRALTIPNGIDASVFYPRDRHDCRRRHEIQPGHKLILSAGGLIQLKGYHVVIRAVKEMVGVGMPVTYIIAGGTARVSSYEGKIRAEIAAAGLEKQVRMVGRVSADTLAELMTAADVYCLASNREGWPNVVHEALACGLPVVATDVGAIPEMIPSSAFGTIVPPGDSSALTQALRQALLTDWNRMSIAAWGQARSWDRVAGEVVDAMTAAVKEGL